MVFMTSHTEEGRNDSQVKLEKRLEKNMKGETPNITVFPEGTLNNCDTIMKFKKGGFNHTYPIKIICSKFFHDDKLSPSFANMNAYSFFLFALAYPGFFNEFYEIEENIDPLYILSKHNIKPEDPNAWVVIADEVKRIMMFMTGMHGTEQGYAELLEYEKMDIFAKDTMGGTFMRRTGCASKLD